jgi:hypothetical protein
MKGILLYTALLVMAGMILIALTVAELYSYLQTVHGKSLRDDLMLVQMENTTTTAIAYLQSIPYESLGETQGITEELQQAHYPQDYNMLNENCGFVATLISFAGNEVVFELWVRCRFDAQEKIEKVKVKFNTIVQ